MRADRRLLFGVLSGLLAVAAPLVFVQQLARSESPKGETAAPAPGGPGAAPRPAGAPPVIDPTALGGPPPTTTPTAKDKTGPAPAAGRAPGTVTTGTAVGALPSPIDPLRPVWEASLAAREEALAQARAALAAQMAELRALEAQVDQRSREATARLEEANKRWDANARLMTPDGTPLPKSLAEANAQIDRIVGIVKKMKPSAAAAMALKWSDLLIVDVLARLPARVASPVLAAMPSKDAARVTAMLARGGAPTPLEIPTANAGGTP